MKRLAACLVMLIAALIGAAVQLMGDSPSPIHLDGVESIQSGDRWTLRLSIENAAAGEKAEITLFNGAIRMDETLVLGSGGVAEWTSPPLTQAGQSLVSVRYRSNDMRQTIEVLPAEPTTLDLFATANTMPSYGEGHATLMILPRDEWGNAPPDGASFQTHILFPDSTENNQTFHYKDGLGWTLMWSHGIPGRVRIDVTQDKLNAAIELLQAASLPERITLSLSPNCVLNDGRDVIQLTAFVLDEQGSSVVDGTLVTFKWDDGFGYAVTTKGQAVIRLPAPETAGVRVYAALSGPTTSDSVSLRIEEKICPHEP